jgi:hypothetical protein
VPEPAPAAREAYTAAVALGALPRLDVRFGAVACRAWQAELGLTLHLPRDPQRRVPRELPASYGLEDSLWAGAREKALIFGSQLESVHILGM